MTQCMHCGKTIHGRIDKKFCNNECKSAYHNIKNRIDNQKIKVINRLLKVNYSILCKINPNQKTKVKRNTLTQNGFNFTYFTNIYTTKKGHVYYFVYDQGYLPLENNFYAIVKKD